MMQWYNKSTKYAKSLRLTIIMFCGKNPPQREILVGGPTSERRSSPLARAHSSDWGPSVFAAKFPDPSFYHKGIEKVVYFCWSSFSSLTLYAPLQHLSACFKQKYYLILFLFFHSSITRAVRCVMDKQVLKPLWRINWINKLIGTSGAALSLQRRLPKIPKCQNSENKNVVPRLRKHKSNYKTF